MAKPIFFALGNPKTNFVFTPNLIFHIFSDFLPSKLSLSTLISQICAVLLSHCFDQIYA